MEKKRRGPLTLLKTSRKARWTVGVIVLLLPAVYLLAYGPWLVWINDRRSNESPLLVGPGSTFFFPARECEGLIPWYPDYLNWCHRVTRPEPVYETIP